MEIDKKNIVNRKKRDFIVIYDKHFARSSTDYIEYRVKNMESVKRKWSYFNINNKICSQYTI